MNINKTFSSPVVMIAFFWLLSLLCSISWFEPHALLRLACIGFAFVAAALSFGFALQEEGIKRRFGILGLFLALFWTLAAASILWSGIPFISFIAFCTFSLLPLTFYMVLCGRETDRLLKYMTAGVFAFSALLALLVIAQVFFLPDMLVKGGVRYPFANPNSFAGFFSIVLFGGLAWMVTAESKKQGSAAFVLCALCLAALILLAGRGAFLSFLLGVTVFLVFSGRATVKKHARCLSGLFVTGIATAGAASLFATGGATLLRRMGRVGDDRELILSSRTDIWQATWEMIENHIVQGHGIGTFFLYYPEYRMPSDAYSGGFMAHNDPLQFWMEMGVLAPLLFYAALFYVLWRSIGALARLGRGGRDYLCLLAAVCGMGAFVLHTHVTFHFYVAPLLLLFGLTLAWWQVLVARARAEAPLSFKPPARIPAALLWFAALMPFCALYVVLQGFLFSEYYTGRAQEAMTEGRMEDFAADINRAHHIGFGMNGRAYLQAAAIPLGILDHSGHFMAAEEKKELTDQAAGLLDQAARHNPRLVGVLYYRALLASYKGEGIDVQSFFLTEGLRLNPLHLPSREKLVTLYLQSGDMDEAFRVVKEGLQWNHHIFDPVRFYEMAIPVLEQAGDKDAAAQAQEKLERAFARQLRRREGIPFMGPGRFNPLPEGGPGGSAIVP